MRIKLIILILFCSLFYLQGCSTNKPLTQIDAISLDLRKFQSSEEFAQYIEQTKAFVNEREKMIEEQWKSEHDEVETVVVTASRIDPSSLPSITNNQVQGVDEGDIIKRYGDYIFVLRKGSIYSIRISDDISTTLVKVSEQKVEEHNNWLREDTWFDEMLIDKNVLLVTGFNYDYSYTVLSRFDISANGVLTYKDTHLMVSEDYFSGSNYGTRLFKGNLISYVPVYIDFSRNYLRSFPKIARIDRSTNQNPTNLNWKPLINEKNIYKPTSVLDDPYVHVFIKCPLSLDDIRCEGVGLTGDGYSEYYITGEFIYLWVNGWKGEIVSDPTFDLFSTIIYPRSTEIWYDDYKGKYKDHLDKYVNSKIYRISLEDFHVRSFSTNLVPFDQFSFSEIDGDLYMFGLETETHGSLIQITEEIFQNSSSQNPKIIIQVSGLTDLTNNRFLKDSFIYGEMSEWGKVKNTQSSIIDLETGQVTVLELSHSADRFESLGGKALVVGETRNNNLGLTVIPEEQPLSFKQLFLEDRLEGETRSHAFNATKLNNLTIFGLTTQLKSKAEDHYNYYVWDDDVPSDLTFFNYQEVLNTSGTLVSKETNYNDDCDVSCEDWYGNTRPFFIEDRIFGLSGDELIEARIQGSQIIEERRINITQ